MGMGHVPSGSLRQARPRNDVPRRQYRRDRAPDQDLRRRLARWGEGVAAAFLERRGAEVIARNLRIGRGEVDLLVRFGRSVVAVEVKTVGAQAQAVDPIERIDREKLDQVRSLANQWARTHKQRVRVDFIGVCATEQGVAVGWRTSVA